jgi:hypothetical protein
MLAVDISNAHYALERDARGKHVALSLFEYKQC